MHPAAILGAIIVALAGATMPLSVLAQPKQPPANKPPESVTGKRILDLARDGQAQRAASIGRGYLVMHPGSPRTGEHCAILVGYAYADLLLARKDEARAALSVYDRGCKQRTFRDEFRLEAKRIHRVLAGEPMTTVYPSPVSPKPGRP